MMMKAEHKFRQNICKILSLVNDGAVCVGLLTTVFYWLNLKIMV